MKALTKVKIRIFFKALPQFFIVFAVLFFVAVLTEKYLEAVCFAISFCVFRYKFTNILHCNTTFRCMLLTNSFVCIFVPVTVPLTSSLFGGLITGFAVNYIADLIASNIARQEERKELQQLREEKRIRDIYSMSEEELRQYCKAYRLDFINEEIVVQRLIYHLKGQDLYRKIGYSKPQMIRREKYIEERLSITLK